MTSLHGDSFPTACWEPGDGMSLWEEVSLEEEAGLGVSQWFSNPDVHQSLLEGLLKRRSCSFWFRPSGVQPRNVCH